MACRSTAASGVACFRDWAAEETDHRRDVIEAALTHVVLNRVVAANARSDLFERRCVLMDDWARYLAQGGRQRIRNIHDNLGSKHPAGNQAGSPDQQ